MDVIKYLFGTRQDRPPYHTVRKFVNRLNIPNPTKNKHWSHLSCLIWEWYAQSSKTLSTVHILNTYYKFDPDTDPEKQQAMKYIQYINSIKIPPA